VTVGQFFEIDSSFARGQMEANSLQESVFSKKKKCRLRGREWNICQHKCASVTFNSIFKDSAPMCFTFLDVFSKIVDMESVRDMISLKWAAVALTNSVQIGFHI